LPLTQCGSVTCSTIIYDAKHNKYPTLIVGYLVEGEKNVKTETAENFDVEKKRGVGRIEAAVPVAGKLSNRM